MKRLSWSLWLGGCAALLSGCGSSPTQPAPSSVASSVLTSSVTTTSVALTTTSAHYAGTLTQPAPLPPVPLDLSLFFAIPAGSLRPASAARPIHGLVVNFLVTGGYDTGPGGFSGTIAGTLDGTPANGTFTGTLTANLATGCVAKRNYQGPLTAAALNWVPGDQIETCGGASPLTFTVAPPAAPTPATTSAPTTSTIPGCTYTLSIGPTIDGYPTGGTFSATVTTAAGCPWTAISNAPWIHVTTGSAGSGAGTVTFTADANGSSARIGTLSIAGQIITFNQTGSATATTSAPATTTPSTTPATTPSTTPTTTPSTTPTTTPTTTTVTTTTTTATTTVTTTTTTATTTATTTSVAVTGTINGTVGDGTGGVIPGAQVQVRNVQTGSVSSAVTDVQGRYLISGLPLGTYTVTVLSAQKTVTLTSAQPNMTVNFP
jgi:hypothetical protein